MGFHGPLRAHSQGEQAACRFDCRNPEGSRLATSQRANSRQASTASGHSRILCGPRDSRFLSVCQSLCRSLLATAFSLSKALKPYSDRSLSSRTPGYLRATPIKIVEMGLPCSTTLIFFPRLCLSYFKSMLLQVHATSSLRKCWDLHPRYYVRARPSSERPTPYLVHKPLFQLAGAWKHLSHRPAIPQGPEKAACGSPLFSSTSRLRFPSRLQCP